MTKRLRAWGSLGGTCTEVSGAQGHSSEPDTAKVASEAPVGISALMGGCAVSGSCRVELESHVSWLPPASQDACLPSYLNIRPRGSTSQVSLFSGSGKVNLLPLAAWNFMFPGGGGPGARSSLLLTAWLVPFTVKTLDLGSPGGATV